MVGFPTPESILSLRRSKTGTIQLIQAISEHLPEGYQTPGGGTKLDEAFRWLAMFTNGIYYDEPADQLAASYISLLR